MATPLWAPSTSTGANSPPGVPAGVGNWAEDKAHHKNAGGQSSCDGRRRDDEHEAEMFPAVRPVNERAAQAIGQFQGEPEDGSHKARCTAERKRKKHEDEQTAAF
jgi:hypothetical protein